MHLAAVGSTDQAVRPGADAPESAPTAPEFPGSGRPQPLAQQVQA